MGKPPQTVTEKNRTGQGNWKGFRGPLQTNGSGYSVWFNEGYYDGYYQGNYQRGWFRLSDFSGGSRSRRLKAATIRSRNARA